LRGLIEVKKEQLNTIITALNCLKGEKLQYVMRAGSMGDFGLGDLVDVDDNTQDDNRKFVPIRKLPRFIIHVDGRFRMTCGDEIILSKNDMFCPSTTKENEPGFDWSAWAADENDGWDVKGNNRYDEICSQYFNDEPFDFAVKKVTVSKWGDLKIEFENGFVLETFVDASGDEECWCFFVVNDLNSFITITGRGLSVDDDVDG
jgi:hypothetical protein